MSKKKDLGPYTVSDLMHMLKMQDPDAPIVIFNSRGEYEAPTVTIVIKRTKSGGKTKGPNTILLSAESDE